MLPIKPIPIDYQLKQFAGVFSESLSIDPPPGRLLADGSLVSAKLFPELFKKLGHLYTSGTYKGTGNEGDLFRLPNPRGRFLKPMDDENLPGKLYTDTLPPHSHGIAMGSAADGTHSMYPLPGGGSQYTWGTVQDMTLDPVDTVRGNEDTPTYTSSYGGDHSHYVSILDSGGAETRPHNDALPVHLHTGQWANVAVAIVYGRLWKTSPLFNSDIAAYKGLVQAIQKQGYHAYRIRPPEVDNNVPVPNAHLEVIRQLKRLRELYPKVYVLGMGSGAHLAALAMREGGPGYCADKFAGIGGIYNLNGLVSANFHSQYTDPYLGSNTTDIRASHSAIAPYVPTKCWHGQADTVIPANQSQAWCSDTVLVSGLAHDGNPITAGFFDQVMAFFNS